MGPSSAGASVARAVGRKVRAEAATGASTDPAASATTAIVRPVASRSPVGPVVGVKRTARRSRGATSHSKAATTAKRRAPSGVRVSAS